MVYRPLFWYICLLNLEGCSAISHSLATLETDIGFHFKSHLQNLDYDWAMPSTLICVLVNKRDILLWTFTQIMYCSQRYFCGLAQSGLAKQLWTELWFCPCNECKGRQSAQHSLNSHNWVNLILSQTNMNEGRNIIYTYMVAYKCALVCYILPTEYPTASK